ncbi:MAG: T9SS type A sorting domain-containing protein [candidate division WOR-3 bacterium]
MILIILIFLFNDTSNVWNVRLLGKCGFGLPCFPGEVISESITYVGAGTGFYIFDIRNPRSIQKIGEFQTLGLCVNSFSVYETLLCIPELYWGISLYNISNLRNPIFISRYSDSRHWGAVYEVQFDGRYAYVACDSGLRIVDFSNPQNPREVGNYNTEEDAGFNLFISQNYAYLANGFGGLRIINVENPSQPYEVGRYVLSTPCEDVYVIDTLAFTSFEEGSIGGLVVLNISNPSSPIFVGRIDAGSHCFKLAINNNYAYLLTVDPTAVNIIDISRPESLKLLGRYRPPSQIDPLFFGIGVKGNLCFTCMKYRFGGRFLVLDVSNPSSPVVSDSFGEFLLSTWELSGCRNIIYTSHVPGGGGISIFDISEPSQIRLIDTWKEDTAYYTQFKIDSNFLYTAGYSRTNKKRVFQIFDITTPENPRLIGYFETTGMGAGVDKKGNYVYFIHSDMRRKYDLWVFDISEPSRPRIVATCSLPYPGKISISNNYCAIAGWTKGVIFVDISNPLNPFVISKVRTPVIAVYSLKFRFPYVYFVEVTGFGVVDASDPRNPILIFYDTLINRFNDVRAWGIDISENFAFLSAGPKGILVYDITNPRRPKLCGFHRTFDWAQMVFYNEGKICITDASGIALFEYIGSYINEKEPRPLFKKIKIKNSFSLWKEDFKNTQNVKISIYNSLGQILKVIQIKDKKEIPLFKIKKGIYFILIEIDKKKIKEKIVLTY